MSLASRARRTALGSTVAIAAAALTAAAVVTVTQSATSAFAAESTAAPAEPGVHLEQRNAATIRRMYADVFGVGGAAHVGAYFARDFVQHDPAIAAGIPGLVAAVRLQDGQVPRPTVTLKHVLADGNLVAVHTHVSATPANEFTGRATAELYRLSDGLIVEHWAIVQDVPATSLNGNSMFSDAYRYDGTPPVVSEEREEANKQFVIKAWQVGYTARDAGVVDRHWAQGLTYQQHNSQAPNGSAAVKGYIASLGSVITQNRFSVADGDLVFCLNQNIDTNQNADSDDIGVATVDFYRVVDSKIVEHWDVIQTVPAVSANGNSLFSSLYPAR